MCFRILHIVNIIIHNTTISASATDDIIPFLIFAIIDTGLLIISLLLGLIPRYLYPTACDLPCDASEWLCSRIVSLTIYRASASKLLAQ